MGHEFSQEEIFNSAVDIVRNLPKQGPIKPSDDTKLKFYSYFKQATCGPNTTPKPKFYQIVEVYKWDAWRKLGDMAKEEAMSLYVDELLQIMTSTKERLDPESDKKFREVLGENMFNHWFDDSKMAIVD